MKVKRDWQLKMTVWVILFSLALVPLVGGGIEGRVP